MTDNALVFFPGYTDHGPQHVSAVLQDAAQLIPNDVWAENLLTVQDIPLLVCALVRHDLGLHLSERSFLALVGGNTPHKPLDGFSVNRPHQPRDLDWPQL